MAHAVESMAYYGEVPWHGLGEPVDAPLTGKEMLKASGTDWPVELEPITAADITTEEWQAVVRTRKGERSILGVVGNRYCPIQNSETVQFAEALIGEGQALYHTGGSLRDGRVVWYLLRMAENGITLPADDEVERYLLVTNSHDGSKSLCCAMTPVRVVCANTLNVGLKAAKQKVYIKHLSRYKDRVEEARNALGLAQVYFERLAEVAAELAKEQITKRKLSVFLNKLCPVVNEGPPSAIARRYQHEIRTLFDGAGRGLDVDGVRGTGWGLFNAVAEWADHVRPARVLGVDEPTDRETAMARLSSVAFGSAQTTKQKAIKLLVG